MKYLPVIVVSLALAVLLLGPWEISYGFRTAARIEPVESWELLHQANGVLVSRWYDHRSGGLRNEQSFQFDRGDIWQVQYQIDSSATSRIMAGQEIIRVVSNRLNEQILETNNELTLYRALLDRDAAGQKPETIRRLKEELELARQTVTLLEKQFNRTRDMLAEGLSSQAQFEQAENALREGQLAVEVAQKRLEEEQAGEKPEQIAWLRSQISVLENTLAFLHQKDSLQSVHCPIDGIWESTRLPDGTEAFRVEDTSAAVVTFPVRDRDLDFLADSIELVLSGSGNRKSYPLTDWVFTGERSMLENESVYWVSAIVPGLRNTWSGEIPVPCRIEAGRVRISEYISRNFRLKW